MNTQVNLVIFVSEDEKELLKFRTSEAKRRVKEILSAYEDLPRYSIEEINHFANLYRESLGFSRKFDEHLSDLYGLGSKDLKKHLTDVCLRRAVCTALRDSKNPDELEELIQEYSLIALNAIEKYVDGDYKQSFASFLANSLSKSIKKKNEMDDMRSHTYEYVLKNTNDIGYVNAIVKERNENLFKAIGTLPPFEQRVLILRYGLEDGRSRTLEEVGKEFKLTRERIRQFEAKALRMLRHPSRSKLVVDYLY